MHYFVNGIIKRIDDTQTFGNFKKKEFIIKTDEELPEIIKFEVINENIELLENFVINDVVTIAFVIKGNEYQSKFYNNIRAIGIVKKVEGRVEKEHSKAMKDNKKLQDILDSNKEKTK